MMAGPIDPRLLRRASATRGFLVAGVAVGSTTAILTLGQAWLLSRSVAGILTDGASALSGLPLAALLLLAVFTGKAVLNWLHQWIAQRTSAAVKSQLRRDIIGARLAHPIDSPASTGGLITLVTQGLDALDGYFSKYLPQLMLAVTVPVIIGVSILTADFWSAVIVAVTMPLIPIFMALVGWTTETITKKRWAVQTRLAHHFADLVTGLPTLQVFGRAKAQARGLKRTEAAHVRETMATLRISFLSAMVLELLSTLSVAVIAVTIGFRVVFGEMDLATALFVLILAPEAYLPIRQVGVHYHDSADGVAAAEAAFGLIDAHEPEPVKSVRGAAKLVFGKAPAVEAAVVEVPEEPVAAAAVAPPSPTALLSVRGLTHTYPGASAPALAPIDFDIAPGEIVAIAGGSGGGKTTLLNSLLGFLNPTGGQRFSAGEPITDWTAWRRHAAFVGQFPGLVNGDVATNVRLGSPEATDEELLAALAAAGAPELRLDHIIGDNAEGVSAGERRRIATARALLRINRDGGRLLILDEPTAGLDADAEAVLLASLRTAKVAVLVVSHRPAVLKAADRVITIEAPAVAVEEPIIESTDKVESTDATSSSTNEATDEIGEVSDDGRPLLTRLLDAVPNSRKWLALSVFLAFSATGASVALMSTSAWLLAFAALLVPPLFLQVPSTAVRFFAISRSATRYAERLAGHNVAMRVQSALRLETYTRLARTTLIGRRRGDLLTRVIADVEAVQDLIVRVWIPFIASTAVIVLTAIGLAFISVPAALVILASAALAGLLLPWLAQRASAKADAAAVPLRGRLGDAVHEIAGAAPDLVAYGADRAYSARLLDIDEELRTNEARTTWVRGVASGAQVLAAGAAVVGALLVAAPQAVAGQLSPSMVTWMREVVFINQPVPPVYAMEATLLAVLVLTPLALHEALSTLIQAAQTHTRAKAALARVEAVLDAEPVGAGDLPALGEPVDDPGVSLRGLSAGWPDQAPVVTGLDLQLARGERVALVGPSGVGKTTVAATVLGLIPAVGGEAEVRGRVGYLAQDAHIFTTSIAENVKIGNRDASAADVRAALDRAGLRLPSDRFVGETGAQLSGGEARRVALARLLVGEFQVLILDEPTEHLDILTATALMDDIWQTTSDSAVLVITHDPAVITRCDRVVTLA
ncbi:MAG: thiol reductant ABC exporter subunit CydD [Actinobacteria bacterium HGW-Actinobacteria-2]|nr:MAG: thiol reductant ABC exporter subunit CydD [Actinobacteria bacterium HGW-Actinobacteria-2]